MEILERNQLYNKSWVDKSIDTTTSYYTGLETAAAVRYFDSKILKLRNDGKDKVR